MLNEELIDNKELVKLKLQIEKFKKYDKERKEYYKNVLIEYSKCKSLIDEYEDIIAKYEELVPLLKYFASELDSYTKRFKAYHRNILESAPNSSGVDKVLSSLQSSIFSFSGVINKINIVIKKLNDRIQTKSVS